MAAHKEAFFFLKISFSRFKTPKDYLNKKTFGGKTPYEDHVAPKHLFISLELAPGLLIR